ncbi:hypothetical protein [Mycolicibacterium sp. CR10]|uniref:hypothetical protein n=1 Tax=Mycolicibacterium sp. CR10 TaxID=2562314 RepID=UPI001F107C7A|nr:hypothetical protein [Mycolicibacterium sp. CR10]
MMRTVALILLSGVVVLAPACTRTSDGAATGDGAQQQTAETTEPTESAEATETTGSSPTTEMSSDEPGVVPTTAPPAAAGQVCVPDVPPPVSVVAQVADPAAPTATVGVPEGWSMSSGNGPDAVGAQMDGQGQMSATVSISATPLDPAAAFRAYSDDLTRDATISTVSLLPAEMCGYSGQKLMGVLSDDAELSIEYKDRIVHVPTAGGNYLIAIHVEAPPSTPGFDEAASLLTEDFEIGIR